MKQLLLFILLTICVFAQDNLDFKVKLSILEDNHYCYALFEGSNNVKTLQGYAYPENLIYIGDIDNKCGFAFEKTLKSFPSVKLLVNNEYVIEVQEIPLSEGFGLTKEAYCGMMTK